jgi:type II secretory pathway pseudopilin PulG
MKYPPRSRKAAFSLVEMMVGTGIFLGIFVGVMVGLQIFGLRVYTLSATKLTATADARKTLNVLREQIRAAKTVYVGNFTNGMFLRITNGLPQAGNALQIAFTTNASDAITYYRQTYGSTNALYCLSGGTENLLANYVTNNFVFSAEDYQAKTMTSYDNNPVIRVTMYFYQWQYPIGFIGNEGLNAYNHYRLQTRVSRRAKE